MNKIIKSNGIKCSHCSIPMELFYEDDLHWKWTCPQCKAEIKGDLPDQEAIQEINHTVEELERTITTVYVQLNGLNQIKQLRELIPELTDVSIAEIKQTLLQNQMKWPIRNYQAAIDAMRPLADLLGLKIADA